MNTRNVILYIAQSLDGYIASSDGDISWLFDIKGEGDNGFTEFYETTDSLIMGKATYEHLMEMTNQQYPHSDRKSYVFTNDRTAQHESIDFVQEDVTDFIKKLKSEEGKDIWLVGGAKLLDAFLKENLVDEFIITTAPLILGNGISLFEKGIPNINLKLKSTKQYGEFVQNHYVKIS
jgi:dihydrofolate reductase